MNHRDKEGNTPLHLGVKLYNSDTVKSEIAKRFLICTILLQNGADPNIPDDKGLTPLDTALIGGNHEMADLLKEHGAVTSKPKEK